MYQGLAANSLYQNPNFGSINWDDIANSDLRMGTLIETSLAKTILQAGVYPNLYSMDNVQITDDNGNLLVDTIYLGAYQTSVIKTKRSQILQIGSGFALPDGFLRIRHGIFG